MIILHGYILNIQWKKKRDLKREPTHFVSNTYTFVQEMGLNHHEARNL
jgi:hypothetical protein